MKYFARKIYTPSSLFKDLAYLTHKFPVMLAAKRDGKPDKQFIEKIMLVTTAVNGCVYCAWFHAKLAMKEGIQRNDVRKILDLQFNTIAYDYELMALLYAQHMAETGKKPDKELTEALFEYYGDEMAKRIVVFIRAIYFGNLSGNTFDAFISRFKGSKAKNSNFLFEMLFFIISAPILLPSMPYVKKYRK